MIVGPRGELRRAKDAALTFHEPVARHHARSDAASTPSSTPPRASRRASVPPEPSCLPELIAAPALLPGRYSVCPKSSGEPNWELCKTMLVVAAARVAA